MQSLKKIPIRKRVITTIINSPKHIQQTTSQKMSSTTKCLLQKTSDKYNDSKTCISDSGVISHMVNSEENLMKLKYAKTLFTVGDRRNITLTTCGNWRGYWRHDKTLHRLMISNMDVITGLHSNIFIIKWALQRGFQVTSEGDTLILKKRSTSIGFGKKMRNNGG